MESNTGYEGLASFCGIMSIPCMLTSEYHKQVASILGIAEDYTKEELINAGQRFSNIVDKNPELDNNETECNC